MVLASDVFGFGNRHRLGRVKRPQGYRRRTEPPSMLLPRHRVGNDRGQEQLGVHTSHVFELAFR